MTEVKTRKKLIEVALPLDAINVASAREKSIRHGHPSTLHLWWARRPLAAARAVIFAQMVDDPSACPELFPTPKEQEVERERLFTIIRNLVLWENSTNEKVLQAARNEVWASWRRACADNAAHPRAKELFDAKRLPDFHDPFAGGGSLPLEAQRLGLAAHASDLNPVAVLLNKAMIEIAPKFAGKPPANPDWNKKVEAEKRLRVWKGAEGLAEDVRYYGRWMREEAEKRIGHLYPKVEITEAMAKDQPALAPSVGQHVAVIAWLWARTVPSPDPTLNEAHVPLVASYWLCQKPGKEAWLEAIVDKPGRSWRFEVRFGKPPEAAVVESGTKTGRGTFRCLLSGAPITPGDLHTLGKAGKIRHRLLAVIADGPRGRLYGEASRAQEDPGLVVHSGWRPSTHLGTNTRHLTPVAYGYTTHASLFTDRQLTALDTLANLVAEVRDVVRQHARSAGFGDGPELENGGSGAAAYADAVAVMLGMAVSRRHDRWTAFSIWHTIRENLESLIRLSAIPMTWEFAEGNPFSESTGNFVDGVDLTAKAIESLGIGTPGVAEQLDARAVARDGASVISTDPPYFDNVPYADLSDLFYVWLRRTLQPILPRLMNMVLVPKADELVADPARHGSKDKAEQFFLDRMREVLAALRAHALPTVPLTVFYAFKQSESQDAGVVSTGWDTFLSATIEAGFSIVGTWPVRTEQTGGLRNVGRNSLATSVVLVCRPREANAPTITRRDFSTALRAELPQALAALQGSKIQPVDLAQAVIGPGMAIFSRYAKVLDAEGKALPVREALGLINNALDEAQTEQEGDFDSDTRWALAWFEQHGFGAGEYGDAEQLSKAKVTSVRGLVDAGIVESKPGKVRLLKPSELPADWDPTRDARLTAWEAVHYLIRVLDVGGEAAAAALAKQLGTHADVARELAYRLYALCDRKKWAAEAKAYNNLVVSWSGIESHAAADAPPPAPKPRQQTLPGT